MSHQYATVEDMQRLAVPAVVLRDSEDPDIDRALIAATSKADSYLENRYNPPMIAPFPESLVEAVASIAAWIFIRSKGIRPSSEDEETIRISHDDAMTWLKDVAAGRATLPRAETSPDPVSTPAVASDTDRGFSSGDGTFGGGSSRDLDFC